MPDQPTKLPISTTAIPALQRAPLPPGAQLLSESEEILVGENQVTTQWTRKWVVTSSDQRRIRNAYWLGVGVGFIAAWFLLGFLHLVGLSK